MNTDLIFELFCWGYYAPSLVRRRLIEHFSMLDRDDDE